MFVKICGITRQQDAEAAVSLGADALGFVFWPESRRFIDPHRARAIVATLPPFVTAVGVFVNQPLAYVRGVAALARLGAVQLHGDETPDFAAGVHRPILKAIAIGEACAQSPDEWPARVTLLIDACDPARHGGTGRTSDWKAASAVAARRRVILAGGLTAENVGEALRLVRPYGIDVSSGVESRPGVKDVARLERLFQAIAGAQAAAGAAAMSRKP